MKQSLKQMKRTFVSIITTFLMMASPVAAIVFASDSITNGDVSSQNGLINTSYVSIFDADLQPLDNDKILPDQAPDFKDNTKKTGL